MGSRSKEISKRFKYDQNIVGVEVGVRYGKNAEQLLCNLPNLKLYLVDRWEKPPIGDSYYKSGDGVAQRAAGHLKRAYKQTKERLARFKTRTTFLRTDSCAASEMFSDGLFDFVFIDADHSYDGVKKDIICWLPKVKKGGYLCGHDYGHVKIGEVKRAVDELLDSVELCSDMTWFWRKC